MTSRNTLSFLLLLFFERILISLGFKDEFSWCWYVSLWVEALNAFLEHVTICLHGLPLTVPLMLPYFMGVFYSLQRTIIISSLLLRLPYASIYIFSEISILMVFNSLPWVAINFFKKEAS